MRTIKRISRTVYPPEHSKLLKEFKFFDYCDSYKVRILKKENIDKITTKIFQTPGWADLLLRIRNVIARLMGLNAGGNNRDTYISDYYPIGSRAVYFTVINRSDDEILMAENDKHLDFWVSVLKIQENAITHIYLTTLVKFNNSLGRIYFFFVKPFHRMIVISLLKRLSISND